MNKLTVVVQKNYYEVTTHEPDGKVFTVAYGEENDKSKPGFFITRMAKRIDDLESEMTKLKKLAAALFIEREAIGEKSVRAFEILNEKHNALSEESGQHIFDLKEEMAFNLGMY